MVRWWFRLLPVVAVSFAGCYRDVAGPVSGSGLTRVLLTDAPAAAASIERVEVYVAAVAASTTGGGPEAAWLTVATPEQRFDFTALRQGRTALAGTGHLPAGRYRAIRLTLRGDSSAVVFADGRRARVRWPGPDPFTVQATVADPLVVPVGGGVIVLDLDVTRSFVTALDPLFDVAFTPAVRAVDAARTGALGGTVFGRADGGAPRPVAYATVRVFRGSGGDPGALVTSGTTDAGGGYLIGFLPSGVYTVEVGAPATAGLGSITVPDVLVAAGAESRLQVLLPRLVGALRRAELSTSVQGHSHAWSSR